MKKLLITLLLLTPTLAQKIPVELLYVKDGDTVQIRINDQEEPLRLIGIDAPESGQGMFGRNATNQLLTLSKGQPLYLEFDVQQRDKYSRLLGYLYTGETMLNQQMIESGWAVLLTIPPNVKYSEHFRVAQRKAQSKNLGVWNSQSPLTCLPQDYRQKKCNNANTNKTGNTVIVDVTNSTLPVGRYINKGAREVLPSAPSYPNHYPNTTPSFQYGIVYENCSQAPGPVYRGQPGYRRALDRDNDGIGCE